MDVRERSEVSERSGGGMCVGGGVDERWVSLIPTLRSSSLPSRSRSLFTISSFPSSSNMSFSPSPLPLSPALSLSFSFAPRGEVSVW